MISIEFYVLPSGEICGFHISGHSGYDVRGKDIVCAAVSSAAYMVLNTLTDVLNIQVKSFVNDEGEMDVNIPEEDLTCCRDLLLGFKVHVISLENMYPQNINVNYLEV